MLADSEIFGIPIFFIFIAIYALSKAFGGEGEATDTATAKVWTAVTWTSRLHVPRTIEITKELLSVLVTSRYGFRPITEYDYTQKFKRGDESIKALPAERDVAWDEFPITLEITYSYDSGKTHVVVRWFSPEDTTFDEEAKNTLYENARIESASWVEELEEFLKECDDEDLGDDEEDDDASGSSQESKHGSPDDYEKLSLTSTATWEQVRAAFRTLSRTYHPDMLHCKDLPPEIVKLSEEKFKEVVSAYARIKALHCEGQDSETNEEHETSVDREEEEEQEEEEEEAYENEELYEDADEHTCEADCRYCHTGTVRFQILGEDETALKAAYLLATGYCDSCGTQFAADQVLAWEDIRP